MFYLDSLFPHFITFHLNYFNNNKLCGKCGNVEYHILKIKKVTIAGVFLIHPQQFLIVYQFLTVRPLFQHYA